MCVQISWRTLYTTKNTFICMSPYTLFSKHTIQHENKEELTPSGSTTILLQIGNIVVI